MVSFIRSNWVRRSIWASLFVVSLLTVALVNAPKPTRAENERVVTVYHDSVEQTVVTDAKTVGEALERAHVTLNKYDSVEPATDTPLVAPGYSVNVYRARPVLVVDGVKRQTVLTAHTSAREIAQSAGTTLYDEDTTSMDRIDDFVGDGAVGLKMTIHRATPLHLVLYGKEVDIRTQAKTIGDLMKEKHIVLQDGDGTNLAPSTPISADLTLQVWRNGVQTITTEEDVAFTTKQVRDTDHEVGYKAVQEPGVVGKKMVTYQIDMRDGKEVSRKIIQSVQTTDPKEQVEVIGARAPLGNISAQKAGYMAGAGIAASDYGYVDFVIDHESHWNVGSTNSGGCKGLGQACPGSKLVAACPNWDIDAACQLRFFSNYANKYGGWEGAYNFWVAHHWW